MGSLEHGFEIIVCAVGEQLMIFLKQRDRFGTTPIRRQEFGGQMRVTIRETAIFVNEHKAALERFALVNLFARIQMALKILKGRFVLVDKVNVFVIDRVEIPAMRDEFGASDESIQASVENVNVGQEI